MRKKRLQLERVVGPDDFPKTCDSCARGLDGPTPHVPCDMADLATAREKTGLGVEPTGIFCRRIWHVERVFAGKLKLDVAGRP